MKWFYAYDGDDFGQRYSFETTTADCSDIAVEAAEDFNTNHDGWECSWPLVIALYQSEEGPEQARYEVDREMSPTFYASEVLP